MGVTNPAKPGAKPAVRPAAPTDLLRLDSNALDELHESLNSQSKQGADPRREFSRWEMRDRRIEVTLHHPGGTSARCLAAPREISAGGAGLLHGGFVYPGAACVLHLRTLHGEPCDVSGRVVRCRHVGKHIHALGVKFDQRVDPREFIRTGASASGFTLERVAPDRLSGRALIVEPDSASRRLLGFFLKDTRLGVEFVGDLAGARDAAKQGFDAIVISDGSPEVRPDECLLSTRDAGVMTPAVALCSGDWGAVTAAAARAGCVVIVAKPYDAPTLHRALGEFLLLRSGPTIGAGAIVSSLSGQPGSKPLVEDFVRDLERAADELARAVRDNDGATCRALCLRLKSNGASHGFKPVSDTAAAAFDALNGAGSLEQAGAEVRRLVEVCRRCTAG